MKNKITINLFLFALIILTRVFLFYLVQSKQYFGNSFENNIVLLTQLVTIVFYSIVATIVLYLVLSIGMRFLFRIELEFRNYEILFVSSSVSIIVSQIFSILISVDFGIQIISLNFLIQSITLIFVYKALNQRDLWGFISLIVMCLMFFLAIYIYNWLNM